MPVQLTQEINDVIKAVHYRPSVSVLLPFEAHVNPEKELRHELDAAIREAAAKLHELYPDDVVSAVLQKLGSLTEQLQYKAPYRSIALFASPVFQKLLYLEIPVEKKVIIDETFEIRDLVYNLRQSHHYLLLLLSGRGFRIYLGHASGLTRILADTALSSERFRHDAPQRVANFSDPAAFREIRLDKHLEHADHALGQVLRVHPLPVFVAGAEKVSGHFMKLSGHRTSVIGCIRGNYDEASESELLQLMKPYLDEWNRTHEKATLQKLETAADEHKLVTGMRDVWKAVMHQRGRLLCLEKNFMYAAVHGGQEDHIGQAQMPNDRFAGIRDAVDDVIAKVLEQGGDVEFVDEGVLEDYHHIALIEYF